jgi:hypothetical protein
MDWDAFARELRDEWKKLTPAARAEKVLRWKKESNRSGRELARILKKSESALRVLVSDVEKKKAQHVRTKGQRSGGPGTAMDGRGTTIVARHPVQTPSQGDVPVQEARKIASRAKPAAASTVIRRISDWLDKLDLDPAFRLQVVKDVRFQLEDNRWFLERDIRKFGVATLEERPRDLQPGEMEDLSIWGSWIARFLWSHPERKVIIKELIDSCEHAFWKR